MSGSASSQAPPPPSLGKAHLSFSSSHGSAASAVSHAQGSSNPSSAGGGGWNFTPGAGVKSASPSCGHTPPFRGLHRSSSTGSRSSSRSSSTSIPVPLVSFVEAGCSGNTAPTGMLSSSDCARVVGHPVAVSSGGGSVAASGGHSLDPRGCKFLQPANQLQNHEQSPAPDTPQHRQPQQHHEQHQEQEQEPQQNEHQHHLYQGEQEPQEQPEQHQPHHQQDHQQSSQGREQLQQLQQEQDQQVQHQQKQPPPEQHQQERHQLQLHQYQHQQQRPRHQQPGRQQTLPQQLQLQLQPYQQQQQQQQQPAASPALSGQSSSSNEYHSLSNSTSTATPYPTSPSDPPGAPPTDPFANSIGSSHTNQPTHSVLPTLLMPSSSSHQSQPLPPTPPPPSLPAPTTTSRGSSSLVPQANFTSLVDGETENVIAGVSKIVRMLSEERARLVEEKEAFLREKRSFEAMQQRIQQVNRMSQSKITINVGGTRFETTLDTLRAEEGSMLDAMFSGKYTLDTEGDTGICFIDRDDSYFPLILSYLRARRDGTPGRKYTLDNATAAHLMREANFYGLTGLERSLAASTALVVSQTGASRYFRVQDALRDAREGDRILVQPGVYFEYLYIDKNVEIIGDVNPALSLPSEYGRASSSSDGSCSCASLRRKRSPGAAPCARPSDAICDFCQSGSNTGAPKNNQVILTYAGEHVITSSGEAPCLKNIVINQQGDEYHCIFITSGCLNVDSCTLTSSGWACVGISGENTHPFLTNNNIASSTDNGIIILARGKGIIEHNNIQGFTLQGIEIREGSNPVIRHNRIHHGDDSGIYINTKGKGVIENNHIYANAFNGIAVKFEGQPKKVAHNVIYDNRHMGIYVAVDSNADGIENSNDIHGNASGNMVEEYTFKND